MRTMNIVFRDMGTMELHSVTYKLYYNEKYSIIKQVVDGERQYTLLPRPYKSYKTMKQLISSNKDLFIKDIMQGTRQKDKVTKE
jgi:hypothetical protein